MNPGDLKLLELLTVDDAAGTLHFAHRRMLLFDADAMGLLRKELIETLGLERARRILTRFGYACGYRDALTSREVADWSNLAEWWAAGPRLHTLEGVASVHVRRAKIDQAHSTFDVEAEWRNSYEAEQHRTHIGLSGAPVCWTLTGYASGHSTAVFGREVFYYEQACVGKGDAYCRVIGRAADATDPKVQALKADYRVENVEAELGRVLEALEQHAKALAQQQTKVSALESQLLSLREVLHDANSAAELIGTNAAFRQVLQMVERVAPSDTTVLLCGETGTGKDLIARTLHTRSARRGQPLITVNCAALPTGLVESELFGHEKGAFTGAIQRRPGRFEAADGGTLFLDEIGDLPLEAQAKLLRVLEHGAFERLGSTQTIRVNVRLVAATNQPLETLVAEGKFRADLFYRVNVFPMHLPPLRERPEDIELLTHYFAQKFRAQLKKKITAIDSSALARLRAYPWPGNVRELEHIIERAVLLADVQTLEGAGFLVNRPFPSRTLADFDPFLLLDEMGPVELGPGEAKGAPDHPHRGFETVTYLLAGRMQHKDSQGHAGLLGPGDVQWMTAGVGVVHSEMPEVGFARMGGRMHGFQLWVNLPQRDKMISPRYQEMLAAEIPTATSRDGQATVKVIAGEALGERAVIDTRTPMIFLHFVLQPGASLTQPVARDYNAFAYVASGAGQFGANVQTARARQMVRFANDGDAVLCAVPEAASEPLSVLLIAGIPLREPVVRYGPFVMNTEAEIRQAIHDYQNGRMGAIAV